MDTKLIFSFLIIIAVASSCNSFSCNPKYNKRIAECMSGGDEKFWRIYHYDKQGKLLSKNSGKYIDENLKVINYHYYEDDCGNQLKILDNSLMIPGKYTIKLLCDSIIYSQAYEKIISYSDTEIVFMLLNDEPPYALKKWVKDKDQITEILDDLPRKTNEKSCDSCITIPMLYM